MAAVARFFLIDKEFLWLYKAFWLLEQIILDICAKIYMMLFS